MIAPRTVTIPPMDQARRPEGLLLCGGRSRRFGSDKAVADVGGVTVVSRVIAALAPACGRLRLVAGPGDRYASLGLPVLVDRNPFAGPLRALADALATVEADRVFVASCDMPFLVPDYFHLLERRLGGADACLPVVDGLAVPLAAIYRTAPARAQAQELAQAGATRLLNLVDRLSVQSLGPSDLEGLPSHLLMNVNTRDTWRAARSVAAAEARRP